MERSAQHVSDLCQLHRSQLPERHPGGSSPELPHAQRCVFSGDDTRVSERGKSPVLCHQYQHRGAGLRPVDPPAGDRGALQGHGVSPGGTGLLRRPAAGGEGGGDGSPPPWAGSGVRDLQDRRHSQGRCGDPPGGEDPGGGPGVYVQPHCAGKAPQCRQYGAQHRPGSVRGTRLTLL